MDWNLIIPWATLIGGALIGIIFTIIINYFTIKKQEQIKLKAYVAQKRIEAAQEIKKHINDSAVMLTINKEINEIEINFIPAQYDQWPLRYPKIIKDYESFNQWYIAYSNCNLKNCIAYSEKLQIEINFTIDYFHNLSLILKDIQNDKYWQIGVIVKNDIQTLINNLDECIANFMQNEIYSFKFSKKTWSKLKPKETEKRLMSTNLMKYKDQIVNHYCNFHSI